MGSVMVVVQNKLNNLELDRVRLANLSKSGKGRFVKNFNNLFYRLVTK